jgi:hypothetical protein
MRLRSLGGNQQTPMHGVEVGDNEGLVVVLQLHGARAVVREDVKCLVQVLKVAYLSHGIRCCR